MANLASTWHAQGHFDRAGKLDIEVFELRKSMLGEKHPDTIRAAKILNHDRLTAVATGCFRVSSFDNVPCSPAAMGRVEDATGKSTSQYMIDADAAGESKADSG